MSAALDFLLDIISWALILPGVALIVIGAVGMVRFPDFYSRLHPAGVIDTLGAELLLLGMAVQSGFSLITAKLLMIALFLFFTSPTSTHAIANAAFTAGRKPLTGSDSGRNVDGEGAS